MRPLDSLNPNAKLGLAAGHGCLAVAEPGGEVYGGPVEDWRIEDWERLLRYGRPNTYDVAAVLRAMPEPVRIQVVGVGYDFAVDVTREGKAIAPATSWDEVVARAIFAAQYLPPHPVDNALSASALCALNKSLFLVDTKALVRIIEQAKRDIEQLLPSVLNGLTGSARTVGTAKLAPEFATRSLDPIWADVYKRAKRADTVMERAEAFRRSIEGAIMIGERRMVSPVWRAHKHWTFAASGPSVNTLPREVRAAFVAPPENFWVTFNLRHPRSSYERAEVFQTSQVTMDEYAQHRGVESVAALEAMLSARSDAEKSPAVDAANEICTWALVEAARWPKFVRVPSAVWVPAGFAFIAPIGIDLPAFLRQLTETFMTTPRVRRWRDAGAMAWSVSVGRTWGGLRELSDDMTMWTTEVELAVGY